MLLLKTVFSVLVCLWLLLSMSSPTQGGNYVDLHQMMGVRSGTEVLYVGDHIYGDILRSKKVCVYVTQRERDREQRTQGIGMCVCLHPHISCTKLACFEGSQRPLLVPGPHEP